MSIVTIDGPAGSGKSSVAQLLADNLGFTYYNTGLVYRALGLSVNQFGLNIDIEEDCLDLVSSTSQLFIDNKTNTVEIFGLRPAFFSFDQLRTATASNNASVIGSHDAVNELIVELLRLSKPDISFVAEGRNTGSAIFTDANVKFYLDAKVETRAIRHYGEASPHRVEALLKRDARDSTRKFAPLCEPEGAILVDTTKLTQQEVVDFLTTECKKVLHLNL
jgi:cytidylate kinase